MPCSQSGANGPKQRPEFKWTTSGDSPRQTGDAPARPQPPVPSSNRPADDRGWAASSMATPDELLGYAKASATAVRVDTAGSRTAPASSARRRTRVVRGVGRDDDPRRGGYQGRRELGGAERGAGEYRAAVAVTCSSRQIATGAPRSATSDAARSLWSTRRAQQFAQLSGVKNLPVGVRAGHPERRALDQQRGERGAVGGREHIARRRERGAARRGRPLWRRARELCWRRGRSRRGERSYRRSGSERDRLRRRGSARPRCFPGGIDPCDRRASRQRLHSKLRRSRRRARVPASGAVRANRAAVAITASRKAQPHRFRR